MDQTVSKSKLKAHALEYFREIERTGNELIVTDHGTPVLRIIPYRADTKRALRALRGTVLHFDDPLDPVAVEDWEALE